MELNSLLSKVEFLLEAAKKKNDDDKTVSIINSLAAEHTEYAILGRFFGYSVSDYAIASLAWIDSEKTKEVFVQQYEALSNARKSAVDELIKKELYLKS